MGIPWSPAAPLHDEKKPEGKKTKLKSGEPDRSIFGKGARARKDQWVRLSAGNFSTRTLKTGSPQSRVCPPRSVMYMCIVWRTFRRACGSDCVRAGKVGRPIHARIYTIKQREPAGHRVIHGWRLENAFFFRRARALQNKNRPAGIRGCCRRPECED